MTRGIAVADQATTTAIHIMTIAALNQATMNANEAGPVVLRDPDQGHDQDPEEAANEALSPNTRRQRNWALPLSVPP